MWPPLERNPKWTLAVLGGCLLAIAVLLLIVAAVLGWALGVGGGACSASTAAEACGAGDPSAWFAWTGLGALGAGVGLLLFVFLRPFP